ncbi:MAG TPA: ATP-binding cassette domain-containing protein [Vicinamibacterales bacterium]|jgi:ATPase subunit of ABC transporter with duplicated ATPase domains|nr:ATP-binding cassette domain-containing protein [Vicinamibacterales bacterium]
MLSVSNVSMRFGSKLLFDEVTTTFSSGLRYGLTGPNGAGKSTFMKLLTGESDPQKGTVSRPNKLGVLRQDQFAFDAFRVVDTVIMGNQRLWNALAERDVLYAKPDMSNEDGMRLADLEGIVGEEDGYSAESDAAVLLQGLDIPTELHDRTMRELQGGQKVRILLAQALFGHPDALLLDEPTNHLDLDSIHWLEDFLNHYEGTLIVISHDRHFLNHVCTHVADIDYQTIITYTGGYDDMVIAKTQIRAKVESENAQREKKIAQLNDFIARFGAGTRASQTTSRRKEVERLQTTDLARSNIQRPYIKFAMKRPSGKVPVEFEDLSKAFGHHVVVDDFGAVVNRGDKIVLVGRNGVGKTTLLKALFADAPNLDESPADRDAGTVKWGHEVSVGYFPQDHTGAITKGMTAVEWLHQFDPDAGRQDIHGLLGQMLFSGEEGQKPTEALSGGETARLLFCRIMLQKPNVLVLDEPTNHLDLESINALNVALQKYEGTIFLVTHDQDLLEEVGTRVWQFDHGRVVDFKGTYEEHVGAA